jgi:hypothetical protein
MTRRQCLRRVWPNIQVHINLRIRGYWFVGMHSVSVVGVGLSGVVVVVGVSVGGVLL